MTYKADGACRITAHEDHMLVVSAPANQKPNHWLEEFLDAALLVVINFDNIRHIFVRVNGGWAGTALLSVGRGCIEGDRVNSGTACNRVLDRRSRL